MNFLDLIRKYFMRVVVIEISKPNGKVEYISTEANSIHELKNHIVLHCMGEDYSMLIPKHSIISMEVI